MEGSPENHLAPLGRQRRRQRARRAAYMARLKRELKKPEPVCKHANTEPRFITGARGREEATVLFCLDTNHELRTGAVV